MTARIHVDLIQMVLDSFNEAYPSKEAVILFVDKMPPDTCGVTFFRGGKKAEVHVCYELPYMKCVEVITHELGHVAAGFKAGHGKRWKAAMDVIYGGFMRRLAAKPSMKEAIEPDAVLAPT